MLAAAEPIFKAQSGEDRLLAEYFGGKATGFYVEVGACDGVEMSNSFYFEQIGWHGLLIEADVELAEQCRQKRSATVMSCAAVGPDAPAEVDFEIALDNRGLSAIELDRFNLKRLREWTGRTLIHKVRVPARTLDSVLEENDIERIDFITIDVEGHEWDVLRGFDLRRWKPQVVILERNSILPDRRIMRFIHANGYRYLRTTGVNDWFELSGSKTDLAYATTLAKFYLPKYARALKRRIRGMLSPRDRCEC